MTTSTWLIVKNSVVQREQYHFFIWGSTGVEYLESAQIQVLIKNRCEVKS